MAVPIDQLTKDSYDLQFGTNVLGHFHLTSLLLPALLASPEPRVINLSSIGHSYPQSGGIYFETLKGPKKGTWIPVLAISEKYKYYGQSKLVSLTISRSFILCLSLCRGISYTPRNWSGDTETRDSSLLQCILVLSKRSSCAITVPSSRGSL